MAYMVAIVATGLAGYVTGTVAATPLYRVFKDRYGE